MHGEDDHTLTLTHISRADLYMLHGALVELSHMPVPAATLTKLRSLLLDLIANTDVAKLIEEEHTLRKEAGDCQRLDRGDKPTQALIDLMHGKFDDEDETPMMAIGPRP
jgi:hypothetical protein